jgi:hypothetical protein
MDESSCRQTAKSNAVADEPAELPQAPRKGLPRRFVLEFHLPNKSSRWPLSHSLPQFPADAPEEHIPAKLIRQNLDLDRADGLKSVA